jgi:SAM-dependent methyltransferase
MGNEWLCLEEKYLAGSNPREQSGFSRDECDWEHFRRPVISPVNRDGSFLDIGCANGLLMECVVRWAAQDGYTVEPYGLDISEKLVALARQRLPQWRDRIFTGNALEWYPPLRFDFVRTEMVYVPRHQRHLYAKRLLSRFVAPGGVLVVCSYGSTRREGARIEPLVDEFDAWGLPIEGMHDVASPDSEFVITRVVWIRK